jgi:hypothetical protein
MIAGACTIRVHPCSSVVPFPVRTLRAGAVIAVAALLAACGRGAAPPRDSAPADPAGGTLPDGTGASAFHGAADGTPRSHDGGRATEPQPVDDAERGAGDRVEVEVQVQDQVQVQVQDQEKDAGTESPAVARVVRVALYTARGVSQEALVATRQTLQDAGGFETAVVGPEEVRGGVLDEADVVFFTGGLGSVQGKLLEERGRGIVRRFVARGGGYVGVCAGAYLAMQGPREYHHVAFVAARNFTEDAWRRGVETVDVRPVGSEETIRLFYANGPVFKRDPVDGLADYVSLALFVSDVHCDSCGTPAGDMPGTPAVLAAAYGEGRILLFSPNPALSAGGEAAHPELIAAAVRWAAAGGLVLPDLAWRDVFP